MIRRDPFDSFEQYGFTGGGMYMSPTRYDPIKSYKNNAINQTVQIVNNRAGAAYPLPRKSLRPPEPHRCPLPLVGLHFGPVPLVHHFCGIFSAVNSSLFVYINLSYVCLFYSKRNHIGTNRLLALESISNSSIPSNRFHTSIGTIFSVNNGTWRPFLIQFVSFFLRDAPQCIELIAQLCTYCCFSGKHCTVSSTHPIECALIGFFSHGVRLTQRAFVPWMTVLFKKKFWCWKIWVWYADDSQAPVKTVT